MAITNARVLGSVGAEDRVLGWWDRDVDRRPEAFGKNSTCWFSIVSAVCQKQVNWAVDLIQQARQGGRIANVFRGQIGADDLTADKIKTKVQLEPILWKNTVLQAQKILLRTVRERLSC